jgi:hypothetical protein
MSSKVPTVTNAAAMKFSQNLRNENRKFKIYLILSLETSLPHRLPIVEPTVAFSRTSLTPHQARPVQQCTKEDRTWYEGEQAHQRHPEAHCHGFVLFVDTPDGHQKITSPSGGAREFGEAHNRKEDEKGAITVDRT